jgi:diguanylate cyclase (GGDEF)-like protein
MRVGYLAVTASAVALGFGAAPTLAAGLGFPNGSRNASQPAVLALPTLTPLPSPSLPIATPKLQPPPLPSPSLPTSLPIATPTVSPPPLPTPSLPTLATPTPPITVTPTPVLPTPSPLPGTNPGGKATGPGGQSGGGGSGGPPPPGLTIPFTSITLSSPLDVALAVSLAALPLLAGIWFLVFGRTWREARAARDARLRMALAHDLGLRPRELVSLSTQALFKLREQAAFDDLTGVLRRAAGIAAAEHEIARARRNKTPLTVAFLDLDGLKQVNDGRGHAAGDQLLKGLASGLKTGLRGQDIVLRYGGDEFVCVLPDTPGEAAREKLRQIQAQLAQAGIKFSIGLVQLDRNEDVVSVLGRADSSLYDAKARRASVVSLRSDTPQNDDPGRKRVPA